MAVGTSQNFKFLSMFILPSILQVMWLKLKAVLATDMLNGYTKPTLQLVSCASPLTRAWVCASYHECRFKSDVHSYSNKLVFACGNVTLASAVDI